MGEHGFDCCSRKVPSAAEQLSLCPTSLEPVCRNKRAAIKTAMKTPESPKKINKIFKYIYKGKDSEKILGLINLEDIT